MKRVIWISLLAILAFAAIILVRLPVQWVAGFLPSNIQCQQLGGTVWNGQCTGLVAQGVPVGDLVWQLHAGALLSRKVSAHVEVTRGSHWARGDVEGASGGRLTARNLTADLPLDHTLIPQLPRDLVGGGFTTQFALLQLENGAITTVQGELQAHNLEQIVRGQRVPLGDYSLVFPAANSTAEPVGQLKSLSGPLKVEGTLKLTRPAGYEVHGRVATTHEAPPVLVDELMGLGPPDAQGWRQFDVEVAF